MNNDEYTPLTAHFEFLAKQSEQLKKDFDWLVKQSDIIHNVLCLEKGRTWKSRMIQNVKKIKQIKKEENCFCSRIQVLKGKEVTNKNIK